MSMLLGIITGIGVLVAVLVALGAKTAWLLGAIAGFIVGWVGALILALLFLALCTGIVKLPQVRETGLFLTSILPVLFVAPTVGIVEHWSLIRPQLLAILLILLASTVIAFGVSGKVTQLLMKKGGEGRG